MTIKEQADALVEKYRPYVWRDTTGNALRDRLSETRNATLCALESVKDRIEMLNDILYRNNEVNDTTDYTDGLRERYISILKELESRL
jgi:hypothetical protein